MGLDQYAYVEEPGSPKERFAYWRKHTELDNWMRELYHSRGHTEEFNCIDLELFKEDLDNFERDVLYTRQSIDNNVLYNGHNPNQKDLHYLSMAFKYEEDYMFLMKSRMYLNKGYRVYYANWY